MILRQSTSQVIRFGPFVDATDGATAETALTIAQADMMLSKDGGAFAAKNAAGNATHDTDGYYSTTLDTTDTATVGEMLLQVNVAGALPVRMRWFVVEEAIYDAFYASGATGIIIPTGMALEATVQSILTGTVTTLPAQLDSMSGATFDTATDSLEAIRNRGDLDWSSALGSGGYGFTYTLVDDVDSNPIVDAQIWVTSDLAGDSFLYSGYTDELGQVTFYFVTTGTYYFWRRKSGVYFSLNPDTEVVS